MAGLNPIHLVKLGHMKLSVAPESTRTDLLAMK